MDDATTPIAALRAAALAFRDARDWAQFHRPKDLALALGIEAGELGELFLWKGEPEIVGNLADAAFHARVAEELADVLLFTLYLSDACQVDLAAAVAAKLAANERRYPVALARGSARKYSELARGGGGPDLELHDTERSERCQDDIEGPDQCHPDDGGIQSATAV